MKRSILVLAIFAGCGDDARTHDNPRVLWFALDGSELEVRLVDTEPPPF